MLSKRRKNDKIGKKCKKGNHFISPEIFTKRLHKFYKDNQDLQQKYMNKEQEENYKMMSGFDAINITNKHIAQVLDLINWFLSKDFPDKSEDTVILEIADGYLKIKSYC